MPKTSETSEKRRAGGVSLPSWAEEWSRQHGEKPLPLREAARLAGLGLTKAKEIVAAKPRLVRFRRASTAGGRAAPHVMPSELREAASYGKKSTASARFVHRCRLAGVNPSQTLWRIVTGCLPDADKIIDAMHCASDNEAGGTHNGNPLFLSLVGGSVRLPEGEPRSFVYWLARYVLRNCSRKVPRGSLENLWRMALRKTEREGRLFRHLLAQKMNNGRWRLSACPDYWRTLKRVPGYAGERRLLERAAGKRQAVEALGEILLKSGSGAREANLAGAAFKRMGRAKPAPHYPAFKQARAKDFEHGTSRREREEEGIDFSGSVGAMASLGADARAEEALTLLMAAGLSERRAITFLRAYWQREKNPLNSKLSASAVRQIFGMSTRARTGKSPERRKKKPSRNSAR